MTRTALVVLGAIVGLAVTFVARPAGADEAPVALGAADSFAVLGGAGVTNTGTTVVKGDLGTCPTLSITGFPPGVVNGTIAAGGAACQAQSDLTIAYDYAAGRPATTTYLGPTDLGGTTLTPGVGKSPTSFGITGTLTLDARGDPNAIFIFQAGSTLITAVNSNVSLINGAQACNVFWQVGSSATLGVGSNLVGTVLALASITTNTSAAVQGRLFARNGATTLDSNTITRPMCTPIISGSLSLAQTPTSGTALIVSSAVNLPVTTVTDSRNGLVRNWTVTATSSDLVSAGGSTISGADIALEQSGTFTTGTGTVGNDSLVSATADTIDSVYTYTPTAELAPQGNIPAGSYAGTVTQTVL
jgi:hypothetical protein